MVEKRKWHWVEWLLFAIFSSFLVYFSIYTATEWDSVLAPAAMLGAAVLCLPFWRPGYVNGLAFTAAALLTFGSLGVYLSHLFQKPMPVITIPGIIIGFVAPASARWWTIPAVVLLLPVLNHHAANHFIYTELISEFINNALIFGIGYSLQRIFQSNRKMKALLEENERQYRLIQEQNKALEQYAYRVEQLTLLEERNRVARELHDTVGHTFTSVIMGMDAVAYLMETAPDKAKEKLQVLREVTRNGLEEVRRSIHEIAPKEDDLALSQQLSRLAGEFSLHTGTQVRIRTQGEERDVSGQIKLTFVRCLQESLTNAKRHGQASSIDVLLQFGDERITLRIEDDGIGTGQIEPGFGLNAMRERLAALQGTLETYSTPGAGTTIVCSVPLLRSRHPAARPTGTE